MIKTILALLSVSASVSGCAVVGVPVSTVPDNEPQWSIDRWAGVTDPSNAERTGLTGKDFPLPRTTPFDANGELRRAYLDGYCTAVQWQLFARGTDNYLGRSNTAPKDKAWNEGFQAGFKLACRIIMEKNHEDMFQQANP